MTSTGARKRLETGVPGLDDVLKGGLITGSVYIIQGPPGAGKTVLANQIAFSHARTEGKTLYITLLAEAHDRILSNLKSMTFCREEVVPGLLTYLSGFDVLERDGLEGVLRFMHEETVRRGASLVVLDGLFVLEESVASHRDFRRFLNELQGIANLLECTILLLTNGAAPASSPQFTMVDGWIQLDLAYQDMRSFRSVTVRKYRGSAFLEGRHMFHMSDEGVRVLPRLETLASDRDMPAPEAGCYSTGNEGLDAMLGGGVGVASSTLITGPSGVGKTTVGIGFISQAGPEAPGLIFSFHETPEQLAARADAMGLPLRQLLDRQVVDMIWHGTTEHLADRLVHQLLDAVRRRNVRRLLVDGIDAFLQSLVFPARSLTLLSALNNELRRLGVTTFYMSEGGAGSSQDQLELSPKLAMIADNIVLMRYERVGMELRRSTSILKSRQGDFDRWSRYHEITQEGLHIEFPPLQGS